MKQKKDDNKIRSSKIDILEDPQDLNTLIEDLKEANRYLEDQNRELEKAQRLAFESSKRLKETSRKFKTILDEMPILVEALDAKGRVVFWNKACEKVTGYTKQDIIGKSDSFEILYPDDKQRVEVFNKNKKNTNFKNSELNLTTKSGEKKIIAWSTISESIPISDWSSWAVGVDITLRNKKEKVLLSTMEETDRSNDAKTSFLANMSHELRTPLNTILGFSKMILKSEESSAKTIERVKIISKSGDYLLGMLNDILDLSKIEAGYMELNSETFDLNGILTDIVEMFSLRARHKDLELSLDIDPEATVYIKTDLGKLRQILANLISNAIKFTRKGGVSVYAHTIPTVTDSSQFDLLLEVRDTGIGIDPEHINNIFEPFYQASQSQDGLRGTGLGLAITKKFIEVLDGTITIDTKPGVGSVFKIYIPIELGNETESTLDKDNLEVTRLKPGQEEQRVLVAEDNFANRLLLSTILKNAGFKVKAAVDGKEAITIFKTWKPQFIWMDYRMPVMNGEEATKLIRSSKEGRNTKIIALTANVYDDRRKSLMEAGCNEVIHKPFTNSEVFEVMRNHLGVRYDYQKKINSKTESSKGADMDFSSYSKLMNSLPKKIHARLMTSAKSLNIEETSIIIDQIEEIQPELSKLLRSKLDDLDFTTIQRLLNYD